MKEYKILRDVDSEITKKLNQWRHEFNIEIISVLLDNRKYYKEEWIDSEDKGKLLYPCEKSWGTLIVMLTRERK